MKYAMIPMIAPDMDAGYDQYRKIYENLQIGNDGGSYEYLTQVVSYTACYRNSCDGEYTGFLKQEHSKKLSRAPAREYIAPKKPLNKSPAMMTLTTFTEKAYRAPRL